MMEQWQFLIQKEGERTWHPLEKPNIEIMEGRYRVVARSNLTNTDVEVRVTHSSLNQIPPLRIQKRRRRTNSDGLTAVIPFTYLKSGIWELQCSNDLMSDLLGASWQYTVSLQVIARSVDGKTVSPKKSSKNLDNPHKLGSKGTRTKQPKSSIKNVQSNRYSLPSNDLKTNDAGLISSISIEAFPSRGRDASRKLVSTSPNAAIKTSSDKVVSEKPAEKLRESLKAASGKQKAVSKKPAQKSTQKPSTTPNKTVKENRTEKLPDSAKAIPEKAVSASLLQKQSEKSQATSNKAVSKKSVQKPSLKAEVSNKEVSEKPTQKANLAIVEQTVSPVRIKGDTAEQILQNLIELALPSSEPLLPDSAIENTPIAPSLPLLLTLDKVNYIERWGETITLDGLVQLKETTNEQIKQIFRVEVRVELRSPQSTELLQSFRRPNPNQSLPFAIASSIEIPQECSSKLILGEVKVYGAPSSDGVLELLATQSFTITADITELLAITVANPRGESDSSGYSTDELSARNAAQMLKPAVSLDLELFNLVKTVKPEQSVPGVPSTKKSLPPRIEPRKLRRRVTTHSLKLPNVPGYQEKIDEYINNGYIDFSGSAITGTSFPYLRKLKALPSSNKEVESDVYKGEESTYTSVADNQNIAQTPTQVDNTSQAELVVDKHKSDNYFEFEEPVTPRSSEFIAAENHNTSPLIRQWMLSQGYSLPEPIDVEYEDYDISADHQEMSHQQASLTAKTETDDSSQLLNREKAQEANTNVSSSINIQPTPSPYLSISTSSGWEINQIPTPSTQIAQEIVVDDTDIFADNILEAKSTEPDEPIEEAIETSSSTALTISTQKIEQLPTPQLYIPQGELLAGKSLNLRVRLPEGNSHLAVKLWLEDCQTRYLLDGPHLLTNLTPNKNKELEVITKLNIPFGCIEIRLEAIAINTATQQESHKFTVQRTVIPPDLPNIEFDTTLGM